MSTYSTFNPFVQSKWKERAKAWNTQYQKRKPNDQLDDYLPENEDDD